MTMVARTPVGTYEKYCDMNPQKAEEVKLKLIHIIGFAAQKKQKSQLRCLRASLPSVPWVICSGLRMV